ncbi:MAG: hypothetical protein AB1757_27280 [Acidobacteriota bacterium]
MGTSFVRCMGASQSWQPQHKAVIQKWLQKKINLRLAVEDDCIDCKESITAIHQGGGIWKPIPNYHPYYAVGDFNGDSKQDFAIVLIDKNKQTRKFVLAVFNAPFTENNLPSFLAEGLDLSTGGLFFGPPRPKPYRLVIGPFESDNTLLLIPKGKTYFLK